MFDSNKSDDNNKDIIEQESLLDNCQSAVRNSTNYKYQKKTLRN